jgi:hypothetical protein
MKKFVFTVIAAIVCASPSFAQSSSDGFTVSFDLGSSPIAEAFTVSAGLSYNAMLSENISLEVGAKVGYSSLAQVFGLGLAVKPTYTLSLFSDENVDLEAYAALDTTIVIVPTPVGLYLNPKAGIDLTYNVNEMFSVLTNLELSLAMNFDGQPIVASPFLGVLVQGDVVLSQQLGIKLGSAIGTDFAAVYFNPFVHLDYVIAPTIGLGFEAGYDDGVFLPGTAGWYISLSGRIKL